MSTTFTFTIEQVDTLKSVEVSGTTLSDVVDRVHWRLVAVDSDGTKAQVYGEHKFDTSSIDISAFVPAEDVTADVLGGWIKDKLGSGGAEESLDYHKSVLVKRIESLKVPLTGKLVLTQTEVGV